MADAWDAVLASMTRVLSPRSAGAGEGNRYALDRAQRVSRLVAAIAAATPEKQRPKRVDLARIAAIFAAVPWAAAGATPSPAQHDEAAELAGETLKTLVPVADGEMVVRILGEYRQKAPAMGESRLLSDAVALEEMGLVGLWNQTRAFHAAGKTLEQLLRLWKAQAEYGYWGPRIADGLHFEATKAAAKRRIDALHTIFDRMAREHEGRDV